MLVVHVSLTENSSGKKNDDDMRFELSAASDDWWQVTDTEAYAVTRQSGATAVAGAGIFISPTKLWSVVSGKRYIHQSYLMFSFVAHVLPTGVQNSPADIGISPIGIGLFGNRAVMGVGCNISENGVRPVSHNRYVYIGFSASKLFVPVSPSK
jgi:hypothetical protein